MGLILRLAYKYWAWVAVSYGDKHFNLVLVYPFMGLPQ
jgi:hypothetical protein